MDQCTTRVFIRAQIAVYLKCNQTDIRTRFVIPANLATTRSNFFRINANGRSDGHTDGAYYVTAMCGKKNEAVSSLHTPAEISLLSLGTATTKTKQAISTNFHSMFFGAKKEKN